MNKKLIVIFFVVILIIVSFFQCTHIQAVVDEDGNVTLLENILDTANDDEEDENYFAEIPEPEPQIPQPPTRAETVTRALMISYPDIIEDVSFINDDWAVLMRGSWYYYADGRMLPEAEIANIENYRSVSFYDYPKELPPWVRPSPEEAARYSTWATTGGAASSRRSHFFLDALWQAGNQVETESRMVWFNFLGRSIRVHQRLRERLLLIESEIREAAILDQVVQTFINTLGSIESYGWRNIAITDSRSYHSYGLALDILPRSYGGRQTYWLWTSQSGIQWWNVPYTQRYHPPETITKIFESYGFIWGGKWLQYDTMHYEYRPEILILNNFTVIGLND
ncbi:MAG: M15 family metallopeptidase [Treponema sp.]|nr:M15 family metallopeptidase [Treponema sp.]